ncbi:HPP family protein [Marinomonas sp. M1K-6]|uniref:HPP family protein n=1 Tax=Marinomonas profundi TaxID=2726122 RepID=A0A847RCX3_9GAMM|nr:HPP family protein [Marinomonas profundi]NLQ18884.1 HPP family protein [Marinomonas profundi]UDV01811.1 HPP family protein [Marinomonas profundi]
MFISLCRNIARFIGVEINKTSHFERFLSGITACIALAGVFYISGLFLSLPDSLLVVASIGASAVLLFAIPHGALSQPWPFVAGHLISAFIGISFYQAFGASFMIGAMAVGTSIIAMHYLGCLHPPGGSTALFCVIGGSSLHAMGYEFLLYPLLSNLLAMLLLAFILNNAFYWRRYPSFLNASLRNEKNEKHLFEVDDLYHVLEAEDVFIDVSAEELMHIYNAAREKAKVRHKGLVSKLPK